MNLKIIVILSVLIVGAIAYFSLSENNESLISVEVSPFTIKYEGDGEKTIIPENSNLFNTYYTDENIIAIQDGKVVLGNKFFELKPGRADLYDEISIVDESTIVVVPIFTISAYAKGGFYDYYFEVCDERCINSIPIGYDIPPKFESSDNAIRIFHLLGYQFITDIEIDKNPDLLKKFNKVILLHNEYVTKTEFDAITAHPNVVYLYTNALYAEITVDYARNTISLIRGHDYPDGVRNGFNWKFDNTNLEYNTECQNWEFYKIDNGVMLDCYPEKIIYRDKALLMAIK